MGLEAVSSVVKHGDDFIPFQELKLQQNDLSAAQREYLYDKFILLDDAATKMPNIGREKTCVFGVVVAMSAILLPDPEENCTMLRVVLLIVAIGLCSYAAICSAQRRSEMQKIREVKRQQQDDDKKHFKVTSEVPPKFIAIILKIDNENPLKYSFRYALRRISTQQILAALKWLSSQTPLKDRTSLCRDRIELINLNWMYFNIGVQKVFHTAQHFLNLNSEDLNNPETTISVFKTESAQSLFLRLPSVKDVCVALIEEGLSEDDRERLRWHCG